MAHFDGNLKKYSTLSQLRTNYGVTAGFSVTDPTLPNNQKYFQRGDLDNYNFYELSTTSNIYQLYNSSEYYDELIGPFNLRQNTTPKKLLSSNYLVAGRLPSTNGIGSTEIVYELFFLLSSKSSSGCMVDTASPQIYLSGDASAQGPYIYTKPNYSTDTETTFISYLSVDIGFRNNYIYSSVKDNLIANNSSSTSYSYSYGNGFIFNSNTNILTWEMDMDKIKNLIFNHVATGIYLNYENSLFGNILAYGLVNIGLGESCPQSTLNNASTRTSWYDSRIGYATLSSKRYVWLKSSTATYAYVKNIYLELTSYDCVDTPILSFQKPIINNKDYSFYLKIQKESMDLLESVYVNGTKYTPSITGSSTTLHPIELTHQEPDFYTQCYIMGDGWDSIALNDLYDPVFIINNIM